MPVKKAKKASRPEKPIKKEKKPKISKKPLTKKKKKEKEDRDVGGAVKDKEKMPDIPIEPPLEKTPDDEKVEKLESEILDELPEELRKIRDNIPEGRRPGQRGPGRPPKPAEGFHRLTEIFETEEYSNLEILVKPWTNALDGLLQLLGKEFSLSDGEKISHTQVWASYLSLAKPEDIDPEKMIEWTLFLMYVAILAKRAPRGYDKLDARYQKYKKVKEEEKRKRKEEIERKKNEQN